MLKIEQLLRDANGKVIGLDPAEYALVFYRGTQLVRKTAKKLIARLHAEYLVDDLEALDIDADQHTAFSGIGAKVFLRLFDKGTFIINAGKLVMLRAKPQRFAAFHLLVNIHVGEDELLPPLFASGMLCAKLYPPIAAVLCAKTHAVLDASPIGEVDGKERAEAKNILRMDMVIDVPRRFAQILLLCAPGIRAKPDVRIGEDDALAPKLDKRNAAVDIFQNKLKLLPVLYLPFQQQLFALELLHFHAIDRGADAAAHDARLDGLCQIVVRALVKRSDLGFLLVRRGDNDNGNITKRFLRAHDAKKLKAIHNRHF